MAVRAATTSETGTKRTWLTALALIALFSAALFLRAYWNLDAARDDDGTFVLSGGSDPYYHKRAVDSIQQDANGDGAPDFKTLFHDPLLNYPYGAVNPNPPIYEWSVAVAGKLMEPFFAAEPERGYSSLDVATWWAMEWSPAIFGALTVFPIYFLGAALFDRRAGLVAALLWTLSTSAIDATGLGLADHDAAIMFFASLAFLFYVQAIRQFRGDGNWVVRWSEGASVASGLGRFLRERRLGIGYAVLSGLGIGAVGLVWKGFPYVIGIMFLYAVLQMVIDHWRNRDSTGLFVGTFVAFLLGTLMTLPYYSAAGVANFLTPVWYMVGAFFVAGLVLVPTRDLPSILVMPAVLIAGLLGLLVAFFVVPEVATSLLYSAIYFKRTRIYETIAEAHPADFSTIVFGIGPLPFFLALVGWFTLALSIRKHPGRPMLFALVWGLVALYFANTAVRFLFNAIPVFCLFAGYYTIWLIDWLDFTSIRKSLAANRGNFWQGLRKGTRPLHVISVVLAVLLFVLPNGLLAADAAMPPETEERLRARDDGFLKSLAERRLGAYGQGFIPGYWVESLTWLDQHDAHIPNAEDRPAFLSWWDYGHWAIAIGRHPAVADNFQNGYELAAHFLLAQNETHAIQLLGTRLSGLPNANLEAALTEVGAADPAQAAEAMRSHQFVNLTTAQSVQLLSKLEANTGKKIRYFATDVRMLPYDDPASQGIESRSIFHAPVKLAGFGDDDFVSTRIDIGRRVFATQTDTTVSVVEFEQLLRNPVSPPSAISERLDYQESFFNTMYYRAQVGTPVQGPFPTRGQALGQAMDLNNARPGFGLEHFRVVHLGNPTAVDFYGTGALAYSVVILEYYPGAIVEGTIVEEGEPVQGVTVTAYDDAGHVITSHFLEEYRDQATIDQFAIPHASTVTDASGRYSLVAPFSLGGNVTIVAARDGAEIARLAFPISREAAQTGERFTQDISLQKGTVTGTAYEDVDGDGVVNATNDRPAAGVTILVGGRSATTDDEGKYTVTGVSSGNQAVAVDNATLEIVSTTSRVSVAPGGTSTHDVLVQAKAATLAGVVTLAREGENGAETVEPAGFATLQFVPDASVEGNTARATSTFTDNGGNYTATLRPGTYTVNATLTSGEATYEASQTVVVGVGEAATLDLRLARRQA